MKTALISVKMDLKQLLFLLLRLLPSFLDELLLHLDLVTNLRQNWGEMVLNWGEMVLNWGANGAKLGLNASSLIPPHLRHGVVERINTTLVLCLQDVHLTVVFVLKGVKSALKQRKNSVKTAFISVHRHESALKQA